MQFYIRMLRKQQQENVKYKNFCQIFSRCGCCISFFLLLLLLTLLTNTVPPESGLGHKIPASLCFDVCLNASGISIHRLYPNNGCSTGTVLASGGDWGVGGRGLAGIEGIFSEQPVEATARLRGSCDHSDAWWRVNSSNTDL